MQGRDARLNRLQIAQRSQARIAVAVELQRYAVAVPLHDGDQSPGAFRGDDSRLVLDHDPIDAVFRVAISRVFSAQWSSVWTGLLVYINEVTISAPSALAICAK